MAFDCRAASETGWLNRAQPQDRPGKVSFMRGFRHAVAGGLEVGNTLPARAGQASREAARPEFDLLLCCARTTIDSGTAERVSVSDANSC
jgi:hypothetical protein